jgi:sugar/nucleoside kinase (ribokinase family)
MVRPVAFDVICAGEALWKIGDLGDPAGTEAALRFRPNGGAVDAALRLARGRLRVGLATVLKDDRFGRAARGRIAAAGVDVGGVSLTPARHGLVFVDRIGGARQSIAEKDEEPPFELPAHWQAQIVLLSGLSPVVSHVAALCRAARAARRIGAVVVLDAGAGLHAWSGRDPRTFRMLLREIDVARCSVADLATLGMDVATMRTALRPDTTLVMSGGAREAIAVGPFGEVTCAIGGVEGTALSAAICAELVHPGAPGESAAGRWHRVLSGVSRET